MAKSNRGKLLIGLGVAAAGVAAYTLMKKKNALDTLQWSIKSVSIDSKRTSLLQLGLNFKLQLYNPTNEILMYDSFYSLVNVAGSKIAEMVDSVPKSIVNGFTEIVVPITINTGTAMSIAYNIASSYIDKKPVNQTFQFIGHIIVSGVTIPINQTINFNFSSSGIGKLEKLEAVRSFLTRNYKEFGNEVEKLESVKDSEPVTWQRKRGGKVILTTVQKHDRIYIIKRFENDVEVKRETIPTKDFEQNYRWYV